jgi:methionyl aminopeptidase
MLKSNDACWCGSGQKYKRCHKPRLVQPGHVGPRREVPASIARPPYVDGTPPPRDEPTVKTADVIARMRIAGRVAAEVLAAAGAAVKPGATTDEIDAVTHEAYIERGAYPSTLGYHDYPKSLCTSTNEIVVHGIPDSRALADGDIVNLDITAYIEGVHGDCSATFLVGEVDARSRKLVQVTAECLQRGIDAVRPGRPISDVGQVIEDHATAHGFSVVRNFVGHGIGEHFHSSFQVRHYFDPAATVLMEPGMTFTIEPMINMGTWRCTMWDDGWTAVTADLLPSAQFEHTILVTDDGCEVLTRLSGD